MFMLLSEGCMAKEMGGECFIISHLERSLFLFFMSKRGFLLARYFLLKILKVGLC